MNDEPNTNKATRNRYPAPSCCECCPFDVYPWVILFFLCWLTFGSYWVFDTPGAIQTFLTAWFGGPDSYTPQANLLLYSVYSIPNVGLAIFGGFIIDKILGVRVATLLFCFLILLGQILFALGVQFQMYPVCVVGRFVFGLGGECLTVGQNTYTSKWFKGHIMAFAFGLIVAFSRIGSAVNFFVTPTFAAVGVPFSIWFGTNMCLISFVACIFIAVLDWYADARIDAEKAKARARGEDEEEFQCSAILKFPASAWVIFLTCMIFYISVLTFYTVASDILQKTGFQYSPTEASQFLAIPNFVAIPMSPTFGFIFDRFGRSLTWMIIACAMQVVGQTAFLALAQGWFFLNPGIIMGWIGVAYSMFAAAIWPLLPFVLKQRELGTGYGIMTAVQNAGLAGFPLIIGAIQVMPELQDTLWKYTIPIMIFVGCAGLALLLTFLLLGVDAAATGGVLNKSGVERQKYRDFLNNKSASDTQPLLTTPSSGGAN